MQPTIKQKRRGHLKHLELNRKLVGNVNFNLSRNTFLYWSWWNWGQTGSDVITVSLCPGLSGRLRLPSDSKPSSVSLWFLCRLKWEWKRDVTLRNLTSKRDALQFDCSPSFSCLNSNSSISKTNEVGVFSESHRVTASHESFSLNSVD